MKRSTFRHALNPPAPCRLDELLIEGHEFPSPPGLSQMQRICEIHAAFDPVQGLGHDQGIVIGHAGQAPNARNARATSGARWPYALRRTYSASNRTLTGTKTGLASTKARARLDWSG